MSLDIKKIRYILNMHGVPNYTRNGRIYADTMESNTRKFERVEDLTGLSLDDLRDWLGY